MLLIPKMYTEDLRFGEDYSKLRRCIAISIVDFDLRLGEEAHSVFRLRDSQGTEYTDLFEIHILDLTKAARADALGEWMRLFNAETREQLDELDAQITEVQEAMELVKRMNLGRTMRWLYEQKLKERRDRWAQDEYVRDQGRAEGKAQDIIKLLEHTGDVPAATRERILAERDLETLSRWFDTALETGSIPEFEERM